MKCYGIDGCPAGWVGLGAERIEAGLANAEIVILVAPSYQDLMDKIHESQPAVLPAAIAVDMPIGLPDKSGWRPCDLLARTMLGKRRSSIFPVPSRQDLGASEFSQLKGSGLSIQAFNLFKKIRQVDDWITPERQQYCRETHPELVFLRLNQQQPLESKRSTLGAQQRREILDQHLPQLSELPKIKGCGRDDLLDAAALLISAYQRSRSSSPHSLSDGQQDERSMVMEICY